MYFQFNCFGQQFQDFNSKIYKALYIKCLFVSNRLCEQLVVRRSVCFSSSVLEIRDSSWLWETRPGAETDLSLCQDAVQRSTAHRWVCHSHTGKCLCVHVFSTDTRRECCFLVFFLPSLMSCAVSLLLPPLDSFLSFIFGSNFFILNHMKCSVYPSGDCVSKSVGAILTGKTRKSEGNTRSVWSGNFLSELLRCEVHLCL